MDDVEPGTVSHPRVGVHVVPADVDQGVDVLALQNFVLVGSQWLNSDCRQTLQEQGDGGVDTFEVHDERPASNRRGRVLFNMRAEVRQSPHQSLCFQLGRDVVSDGAVQSPQVVGGVEEYQLVGFRIFSGLYHLGGVPPLLVEVDAVPGHIMFTTSCESFYNRFCGFGSNLGSPGASAQTQSSDSSTNVCTGKGYRGIGPSSFRGDDELLSAVVERNSRIGDFSTQDCCNTRQISCVREVQGSQIPHYAIDSDGETTSCNSLNGRQLYRRTGVKSSSGVFRSRQTDVEVHRPLCVKRGSCFVGFRVHVPVLEDAVEVDVLPHTLRTSQYVYRRVQVEGVRVFVSQEQQCAKATGADRLGRDLNRDFHHSRNRDAHGESFATVRWSSTTLSPSL